MNSREAIVQTLGWDAIIYQTRSMWSTSWFSVHVSMVSFIHSFGATEFNQSDVDRLMVVVCWEAQMAPNDWWAWLNQTMSPGRQQFIMYSRRMTCFLWPKGQAFRLSHNRRWWWCWLTWWRHILRCGWLFANRSSYMSWVIYLGRLLDLPWLALLYKIYHTRLIIQ